ncbi:extracellular solute-binding protein [Paenibacillus sp. GYB004]|uniref:ABC transporter substrate-binding protein n=1 Tax=Paenibacillus sp. GYB004 TaxID=2994393 RepID=UPI002F96BBE1
MVKTYTLSALAILLLTTACSDGRNPENVQGEREEPPKPFTLTYYTDLKPAVMELEASIIQKKFPHITVKPVLASANLKPEHLAASGNIPDLISYTIGTLWNFRDHDLLTDLNPFIQKHGFDMNRFLPNVKESIQAYSDKGETLFIPYTLSTNVLYFNKNIFNKFGVPYPKDGMTWDEVYDLAKKVTRTDGTVKYKGFQFQHQNLTWKNQLMQPLIDPNTFKSLLDSLGWRRWVETMGGFLLIPGNENGGTFEKAQDVAMYSGPNMLATLPEAAKNGLDWDVVSLPTFTGNTSEGTQMISPFYGIPPNGKHMDETFRVIAYMLSEEVQILKSRRGMVPIIDSQAAASQYGKDLEGVEGKNLAAFFQDKVGKPFRTTKYDDIVKTVIYKELLPNYFRGTKDINTAFREAEESSNKQIEEKRR